MAGSENCRLFLFVGKSQCLKISDSKMKKEMLGL